MESFRALYLAMRSEEGITSLETLVLVLKMNTLLVG